MLIGCGARPDAKTPAHSACSALNPRNHLDFTTIPAHRHTGESRYPQGFGESFSPGLNTYESSKTLATKSSDLLY